MIIEQKIVPTNSLSPYARKTKKIVVCICDQCKKLYETARSFESLNKQKHHFCCYDCEHKSRLKCEGVAYNFHIQQRDSTLWYEKTKRTFEQKFGGHPFANLDVRQKSKQTMINRYGVDCVLKLDSIHKLAHTPSAKAKRFNSMKQNCSYRKSKPEDEFYVTLAENFGIDDVERQYQINNERWPIDFYVKSIDTYIQLDGVYWHGLDRPIEEIAEHKTKRDVQIHKKWLTDREQDVWFKNQNLKLVRITDKEFKDDPTTCILKLKNHSWLDCSLHRAS